MPACGWVLTTSHTASWMIAAVWAFTPAQWLGTAIPVTHFLRVVRGALLKGQGIGDMAPSLLALTAFVAVITTLALTRYRTTLD